MRLALGLQRLIIFLMGNRFQCAFPFSHLAKEYRARTLLSFEVSEEVVPGAMTVCLVANEESERDLPLAQFGIAPPNSETSTHPTFDHSYTPIEEPTKWPWLSAIENSRCIVPMTAWHICSYWGDPEGTELYFRRADEKLLHVAGVYRIWTAPAGEQPLHTISLLTRPASDYVMDHGSDRQPIFLDESGIDHWLSPREMTCDQAVQLLRQFNIDPQLAHRHHADMPTGWRKQQKQKTRQRGQTMAAQDRCPYECGF